MSNRQELYPKHIIRQALQSNIVSTINMASVDADPDVIRARLGVICELAELFGLADQLRVPNVSKMLIRALASRALDNVIR